MQKVTWSFIVCSLFVTGCLFPSFDDLEGSPPAKEDHATEANGTDTQPSAPVSTSSTPTSTSSGGAGSGDASTPPADAQVDAGPRPVASIKCGSATCSGATQFCCGTDGFGGFCKNLGEDCSGNKDLKLHCDDKSDCRNSEVCCLDSTNTGSCATSCSGGKLLCRNGGCPTGQACTGVIDHLWMAVTNFCQ